MSPPAAPSPRRKVALVTTVAVSVTGLMKGWPRYLAEHGYEVHTVCSPGGETLRAFAEREGVVRVHAIEIARTISPRRDLASLWRLYRLFRRERFDIVHSSTPKGGFLGMLAAWLAGVPWRVYTLRGLPLASASGMKRRILWLCDWLTLRLAHRATAISPSLRAEAEALGLARPGQLVVIHKGSSNGIDAERFTRRLPSAAAPLRREWGIPADAVLIGFAGRITRDKGIGELVAAWRQVRAAAENAWLVLVGTFEPEDPVPAELIAELRADERVRLVGWQEDTAPCFEAMDLLVLPSYREGFGNVLLEANAMELPTVATAISGCRDAVADQRTGILVPPRDGPALADALLRLVRDPELRRQMGTAGRQRVIADFRPEIIHAGLLQLYPSDAGLSATGAPRLPEDAA